MLDMLPRALRTAHDPAEVVRSLHARLADHGIDLPVRLWDGSTLGADDAAFRLVLRTPWTLRELLPVSQLSAAEAFLAGDVDVEGSLIEALRALGSLGATGVTSELPRMALARDLWSLPPPPRRNGHDGRARLRGRRHDPARDAAAIRHHYDVGNDFYRLLLDDDLVYSCAIFDAQDAAAPAGEREALARAQIRKLDTVCRKLHLQPGERLLDIGCGWGALVRHAARHYGVEAHGITLSPSQADLARELVAAEGLTGRVTIRVADYRELDERFDAIASVGMVEHVGHENLGAYVTALRASLADGGRLLNHGITTGRRDEVREFGAEQGSFMGTYVFPDGALVPVPEMVRVLHSGGLEIRDVEQLRPNYALTLRHWVANLESRWTAAVAEVGERTARVWRLYLSGSVVGFERGDLGVVQILATAPDARLPWGRAWMQPVRP